MALIAACSLMLFGCTGAGSGTQSQTQPQQNGQGAQVNAPSSPQQTGTPASSGAQYQPTTGIASLSDNDTSVATGDNDGSGYTDLPVDDGSDLPTNSS